MSRNPANDKPKVTIKKAKVKKVISDKLKNRINCYFKEVGFYAMLKSGHCSKVGKFICLGYML